VHVCVSGMLLAVLVYVSNKQTGNQKFLTLPHYQSNRLLEQLPFGRDLHFPPIFLVYMSNITTEAESCVCHE